MKLIDYTRQPSTRRAFCRNISTACRPGCPFGSARKSPTSAWSPACERELDNRFLLLKNLPLGDSPDLTPYILIGPSGLVVLNVSTQKGYLPRPGRELVGIEQNIPQVPARPSQSDPPNLETDPAFQDFP